MHFFFFSSRRRHTRWNCDWSSDVCSSDLDDHFVVREGLRRLLSPLPDVYVHEAASTQDALVAFREDRPDLVLLDLNLPNSSGLELLDRLLLEDKKVRVLVF